jgi:hypothetical protein
MGPKLSCAIVSEGSEELLDEACSCPVCQSAFNVGDLVVQCPGTCGRWYHLGCWRHIGNRCGTLGCDGRGKVDEQTALQQEIEITVEEAPIPSIDVQPVVDPVLLSEITIVPVDFTSDVDSLTEMPEVVVGEHPDTQKLVVNNWELMLDRAVKVSGLEMAMKKTGMKNTFDRYVEGENYFLAVGMLIVWVLVILTLTAVIVALAISGLA